MTAVIILAVLLVTGCGEETDGDDTDVENGETNQNLEKDEKMSNIKGWLYNGFDKLSESGGIPSENDVYNLYMAKNEAEGCQLAFCADKRYGSVTLETAAEEGAPELTIYKESFVSVGNDYLPDALAPFSGKLTLIADRNAVLYLNFKTDNKTSAGDYSYSFTLKDKDEELYSCTVNVRVMDVALPDTLSCATAVGLYKESIAAKHGISDPDEIDRLYKNYYALMLDYKVTAYDLSLIHI